MTVVVGGATAVSADLTDADLRRLVTVAAESGLSTKDAVSAVAADTGLPRKRAMRPPTRPAETTDDRLERLPRIVVMSDPTPSEPTASQPKAFYVTTPIYYVTAAPSSAARTRPLPVT